MIPQEELDAGTGLPKICLYLVIDSMTMGLTYAKGHLVFNAAYIHQERCGGKVLVKTLRCARPRNRMEDSRKLGLT